MFAAWRKLLPLSARNSGAGGCNHPGARDRHIDQMSKQPVWHPFPAEYETMGAAARSSTGEVQSRQEQSEIAGVLDELPYEQLQIIEFSFVDGLTQSEIAVKLSLPLGTVKSRMRGAFEKLRFRTEREI